MRGFPYHWLGPGADWSNAASPVKDLGPDVVLPDGDFWLGVMCVSFWIYFALRLALSFVCI
jgi:hypothetical protein